MNLTIKKYYHLLLFSFCFLNLNIQKISALEQEESTFSKISHYYLNSFSKPTFTQEEIDLLTNSKPESHKEILNSIVKNKKNEIISKKIVLELFNQNQISQKTQTPNSFPCFLNDTLWKDLEIFCGEHTPSSHLLSKINKTQTHSGTLMLAKMIVEPTTDIEELQKRQNIIRELVENNAIFAKLDSIIKEYSAVENELLSFWNEKNFNTLFSSDFYYPPYPLDLLPDPVLNKLIPIETRNRWNQGEKRLEALTLINNFNSIRRIISELTNVSYYWDRIAAEGSAIYNLASTGQNQPNFQKPDSLKNPIEKVTSFIKKYTTELLKHYTIDQLLGMCDNKFAAALKIVWHSEQCLWNVAQIPITLLDVSKSIKNELQKLKVLQTAYLRLKKAALTINNLIELKNLIDSNSILSKNVDFLNNLKYLFENTESQSKEFDALLKMLKSDTFKNQHPIMLTFSRGKILATSFLMARTQDNLVDILQAIGQIDAYLSLAKLYKETKQKNATYSFANYVKKNTPYINAKEFWTPFINPEKVITNSIELGKEEQARNVIISGPNAGGKSTILKSIIINLLFAQTIGIVPAKELTLTPMTYLDTYLNITDDISSGNSLFKSEVLRVKSLLETIKTLNNIGFCFIIMDEIFSGTNPLEGEAAGYAIGKYLAKQTNTIALIASHFPKITNLEQDTAGIFKNYKVTVDKKENKTLAYPFKLEEGKTNQTIAINILEQENFDPEIIENAYGIIGK